MNKKQTDRAINRWCLRCLFGPASLLSLLAFAIGYWWPNAMTHVQPIAQQLGLHYVVAMRTAGTEFDSAAYLYWLVFWVVLPFNLIWVHRTGVKEGLSAALRVLGKQSLNSGHWNPAKFTLVGGYVRFFFFALLCFSLLVVQLVTAREPSYCKGCETTSTLGFVLINWAGTHVVLLTCYVACAYLVIWKSIRLTLGDKNE